MHSTKSIWNKPDRFPKFPRLDADLHVDVAVVGGGITGLSTALLLAEAGKRVALVERNRLGSGVTGATTAHVTEVLDIRYHDLESKFGRPAAALARAASREAIEMIAKISSSATHDCGFRRLSGYLFAEEEAQVSELDDELDAAERAGLAVERADVPLPFRTRAGLRFANQAQLQPLAYLAALVERLPQGKVKIFEQTPVLDVDTKSGLRLQIEGDHSITCDAVVLATHQQFVSNAIELQVAQYRSYAVAGRAARAPDGLFWDLADPYHYVRRHTVNGDSYVIVGGEDHRTGEDPEGGADAPYHNLDAYLARFGVAPERRWSSQVVEPADGLPFIGKPSADQNVFVATGFSGNGMTFGSLAAMLIRDQILGRANSYAELFAADRVKVLASLSHLITENADTVSHLVGDRLRGVSDEPLENLHVGGGCIIESQGQKLAVYRDHDGALHALSAVCTHKGCQVAWNAVERSWDCPCHGSRFDVKGHVLDGPATKPLEKRKL
jgi:glycine/D-amino acid oxidase-like deaminating enzyme/nitrite reductase/ring-hydroxylating ferredoxin subunit